MGYPKDYLFFFLTCPVPSSGLGRTSEGVGLGNIFFFSFFPEPTCPGRWDMEKKEVQEKRIF